MFTHDSSRWTRNLAAACALAAALGACKKDSNNTAPLVATTIAADAGTNAQSATVGTALPQPATVHVSDQNGAPIAGATVTWTVVSGAGSVSAPSSTTDATGTATVAWTIDTIARVDSLTASITGGATATVTATGVAGQATAVNKVGGDAQTVASDSTSAPFIVKVVDRYGNGVSGVSVAWLVTGGGALSAATSTTDATGTTQVTLTLGATPGAYMITAAALALTLVTFNLTGT
jgi:adhesin/invasin